MISSHSSVNNCDEEADIADPFDAIAMHSIEFMFSPYIEQYY